MPPVPLSQSPSQPTISALPPHSQPLKNQAQLARLRSEAISHLIHDGGAVIPGREMDRVFGGQHGEDEAQLGQSQVLAAAAVTACFREMGRERVSWRFFLFWEVLVCTTPRRGRDVEMYNSRCELALFERHKGPFVLHHLRMGGPALGNEVIRSLKTSRI